MIKITNVRLRNREGLYTVEIKGDKISNISKYSGESGDINGMGNLLTESFVIPHVHIDKVETGDMIEKDTVSIYQLGGGADEAIRKAAEVKKHYDSEIIANRVVEKFLQGISHGVTSMRVFADVDSYAELKGFLGVMKAKEISLCVVSYLPQSSQSTVYRLRHRPLFLLTLLRWIERPHL